MPSTYTLRPSSSHTVINVKHGKNDKAKTNGQECSVEEFLFKIFPLWIHQIGVARWIGLINQSDLVYG
jgi:hypothetical protein